MRDKWAMKMTRKPRRIKPILPVLAGLLVLWCTSAGGATLPYLETNDYGTVDWLSGEVFSRGEADWNQPDRSEELSGKLSLRKALMLARGRLFRALQPIVVDNRHTIGSLLAADQESMNEVRGLAHNAPILEIVQREQASQEVMVGLDIHEDLAGTAVPEISWVESGPGWTGYGPNPSGNTSGAGALSGAGYTGLVVDARGHSVRPALLPRILDLERREIFGPGLADKPVALSRGMAVYVTDLDSSGMEQRVGSRPLHLRVMGVTGDTACDMVIGRFSAREILSARETRQALAECRVIIILDRL